MAVQFLERFYARSWLCLGLLFCVCIGVNMFAFWGTFSMPSFRFLSTSDLQREPDTPFEDVKNIPINRTKSKSLLNETSSASPKIVNPHDFRYIINKPDVCVDVPTLIIIVCTSVNNFEPRTAVRKTWGSPEILEKTNSKLLFLFGYVKSDDLQEKLKNESDNYGDVIQENFIDSYQNLSLKSVALLKWVTTFCVGAKYVLKADDDMYVNIPNLLKSLTLATEPKFVMGFLFQGAKPVQNQKSKWYTPLKAFSEKVYPKYVSGTAYAMTTSAAGDLYKASLQMKLFWLEDVYITGLLARKAEIPHLANRLFNYVKVEATGCMFKSRITGHGYEPTEIYKIHKELYNASLTCVK